MAQNEENLEQALDELMAALDETPPGAEASLASLATEGAPALAGVDLCEQWRQRIRPRLDRVARILERIGVFWPTARKLAVALRTLIAFVDRLCG